MRSLSSAKASRHGARAKEFAPRRNAPLGEGLPTRRTSERICPARERSPRRRPPDTAHERKELPRAGTLPRRRPPDTAHGRKDLPRVRRLSSAKASRHGARAKEFAPRRNAPHGKGLPTRRTGERICPAQERSPRRRPPDTAHERKDLPPRENAPLGEALPTRRTGERICPAGFAFAPRADERRAALDRRTAGTPPLRRGRTREGAAAAEFIHRKK